MNSFHKDLPNIEFLVLTEIFLFTFRLACTYFEIWWSKAKTLLDEFLRKEKFQEKHKKTLFWVKIHANQLTLFY